MPEADVFDRTVFVGLARAAKRDPYRFSLFAKHLEPEEVPVVFLTIHGGTLIVTDRRILEFRPHLETHGAWNVKAFLGYEIHRSLERSVVTNAAHELRPTADGRGGIEDRLVLTTVDGPEEILVSKGPDPTLSEEEFLTLRSAIVGPQAK